MWKNAEEIVEKLNRAGFQAYFVGGCVRDMLMKKPPHDIDITTSALPQEVKALFEKTIDTGLKHGTVTVLYNRHAYEVTTFRTEGEYKNHRAPASVTFVGSIEQDLMRRDFTINAMAYHPKEGLKDPFGGMADIEGKRIRCVGNAGERFEEDALRMLRCIRFACQTGFAIDLDTKQAISEKKELLRCISVERIYAELVKCVVSPYPSRLIEAYQTGLLEMFLPELALCFQTEQNTKYHLYDVGNHILHALECSPPEKDVRLALLLHDIAKPACRTTDKQLTHHFPGHEAKSAALAASILHRLKADSKTIKKVSRVIAAHRLEKPPTQISVKEKLLEVGAENFPCLLAVMQADTLAHNPAETRLRRQHMSEMEAIYHEILENGHPLQLSDLCISGKDLVQAGFEGEAIGDVLQTLFKQVLKCPADNKREILLERIKKLK